MSWKQNVAAVAATIISAVAAVLFSSAIAATVDPQPNPPGTLASVRRGEMAEKTAKCEAYVKRGSLI